jgi:hypothetical protein
MTGLDLSLIAVCLIGIMMLWLLFTKRFGWNWTRFADLPSQQVSKTMPFWLGLITLLSLAALVFSIHALFVVHGILK